MYGYLPHYITEDGLSQAKRWTKAFFSNDPEMLLNLSGEELEKIFSSTPMVELLYDSSMTVFHLARKIKSKSFKLEGWSVYISS